MFLLAKNIKVVCGGGFESRVVEKLRINCFLLLGEVSKRCEVGRRRDLLGSISNIPVQVIFPGIFSN